MTAIPSTTLVLRTSPFIGSSFFFLWFNRSEPVACFVTMSRLPMLRVQGLRPRPWSLKFSRSCRQQSRRREGGAYHPSVNVVAVRSQSTRVTVFANLAKLLRSLGSFNCRKCQCFDREGQCDVCKYCTRNWHRSLSWSAGGLFLASMTVPRMAAQSRGP